MPRSAVLPRWGGSSSSRADPYRTVESGADVGQCQAARSLPSLSLVRRAGTQSDEHRLSMTGSYLRGRPQVSGLPLVHAEVFSPDAPDDPEAFAALTHWPRTDHGALAAERRKCYRVRYANRKGPVSRIPGRLRLSANRYNRQRNKGALARSIEL